MMLLIVIVVVVLLFVILQSKNESFRRLGGPSLAYACEYREECLENNTRSIALTSGIEGVCTMHGLACPSFLLNQTPGNNIPVTPEEYLEMIHS